MSKHIYFGKNLKEYEDKLDILSIKGKYNSHAEVIRALIDKEILLTSKKDYELVNLENKIKILKEAGIPSYKMNKYIDEHERIKNLSEFNEINISSQKQHNLKTHSKEEIKKKLKYLGKDTLKTLYGYTDEELDIICQENIQTH